MIKRFEIRTYGLPPEAATKTPPWAKSKTTKAKPPRETPAPTTPPHRENLLQISFIFYSFRFVAVLLNLLKIEYEKYGIIVPLMENTLMFNASETSSLDSGWQYDKAGMLH